MRQNSAFPIHALLHVLCICRLQYCRIVLLVPFWAMDNVAPSRSIYLFFDLPECSLESHDIHSLVTSTEYDQWALQWASTFSSLGANMSWVVLSTSLEDICLENSNILSVLLYSSPGSSLCNEHPVRSKLQVLKVVNFLVHYLFLAINCQSFGSL